MMDRPIIKRAEAQRRGLKRYYEARACRNGHNAERYVSSEACCQCSYERHLRRTPRVGRTPTHKLPEAPTPPRVFSPPNALPGIPLARLMAGK